MLKQLISQIQNRKNLRLQKSFKKEVCRKSIHLSALWIPALIYFSHPGFAIMVFSVLFVGNTILEYGNYKRYRWARKTFGLIFYRLLRKKETRRNTFQVSGSMYVLMAAIACTLMFSKPVAVIALTVMLISDTCAALFGKAFGTRKLYRQKSLEGTVAFFMSALFINMCYEPIYHFTYAGVIACLAATFAEMFEDRIEIDDNLSVPVVIGIVLTLLG